MNIVKKIGVLSLAKIQGIIGAVMGILVGIMFAFMGMVNALLGTEGAGLGVVLSFSMIILAPIMYGVMGFVSGAIVAWIYNVCADRIGGLEIDLK